MNGIIYYIYHIESGKGYVGKHFRDNLYFRFKIHCRSKSPLGNSIRKYGKEAFKVLLIDTGISELELYQKEIYWVDRLETLNPNGFNLTVGGQGQRGWNPPEVSRLAMSLAKLGHIRSEQSCRRQSESTKGISKSQEHKDKISKALKGKTHSKEQVQKAAYTWSKVTPEIVKAIREQPNKNAWDWYTELKHLSVGISTIRGIQQYKIFKDG